VITVPFDESFIGDPFRGTFREWVDPSLEDLAAAVQYQAEELTQFRFQPAIRQRLLKLLQQRRNGGAAHVTKFGILPGDGASDHLHVAGELLIAAHSYDGRPEPVSGRGRQRHAKPHLDAFGMTSHGLDPRLQGRVLGLSNHSMESNELADLARALRAQHLSASLAITPMAAGVVKGIGGPHPAPSPGRFEADGGPGSPANVAIIDTGRAGQRRTDGWLRGIEGDKDPLDAFPPPRGDGYLDADAGHGTFVTGIVRQIAPGARIRHYRAVDSDGIATEVAIACEMIRAVTEDGAQIVNLSLGGHTHDDVPPIAIAAALEIIEEWKQKEHREVVIVAAAGNYGDKTPCWPAAFPEVVSVAGLTRGLQPAPWSSRGFWVKCSTIAQGVRSTYVEGRESPWLDPWPEDFGANSWAAWSGTSFAAAQVTGALARLHEEKSYSPYEALRRLLRSGRPVPQFGRAVKILPTI
jgi:hypothetical protein